MNISLSNIGAVLNFYFTPRISHEQSISDAVWFGVYVSIATVFAAAITGWSDKKIEDAVNEETELINSFYFAFVNKFGIELYDLANRY